MSGYCESTRISALRPIAIKLATASGVEHPDSKYYFPNFGKRNYSSQSETTMSFRTALRGKPIPDHIADPYAWFLKNGAAVKISDLNSKSTYPKTENTEDLRRSNAPLAKHPPHVDNGHAFWNKKQFSHTSTQGTDYRIRSIDFGVPYWVTGGPVVATGAVVRPFAYASKALFPLSTSERTFGIIPYGDMPDAHYYGQKAIGKLAPNRPDISLSSLAGELREGLPSLIGMSLLKSRAQALKLGKSRTLKAAGKEWVNLQFAIVPLMSDIRKVYEALYTATQRLQQYEADSGKGIRRRMSLVTKSEEVTFDNTDLENQGLIAISDRLYPSKNDWSHSWESSPYATSSSVTQHYTEKVWFSGSFTYFVPLGHEFDTKMQKYAAYGPKLFGTAITAEVLWQLQPWSWLADWLFDLQATISSYQRIQDDNLVVNYGYVMSTTEKSQTQRTLTPTHPDSRLRVVTSTIKTVQKNRVRANPYGFSATTSDGFDLRQWSILGALGFSKLL